MNLKLFFIIISFCLCGCAIDDIGLQPLSSINTTINEPSITYIDAPNASIKPFNQASLLGYRTLNENAFMISIQTMQDLSTESIVQLFALVDGKEFQCTVLAEQQDRLYCTGEPPLEGKRVKVELFISGNVQPVFQTYFNHPIMAHAQLQ